MTTKITSVCDARPSFRHFYHLFFVPLFSWSDSQSRRASHLVSVVFSVFSVFGSWHRFDELCGYPIIHNSLFSLCTQFTHAWFTAAFRLWFVFIPRLSEKDNRIMVAEQCWLLTRRFLGGCTLVRVGTGLDVFWYCGYWNSAYEHRDGLTRP